MNAQSWGECPLKKKKLGFEYVRKETDIIVDVSKAFLRTVEVR